MLRSVLHDSYRLGSLADPPGSSVIVAAVEWLQATLLGTVATVIATIAIATIGLMALAGRISIRHGATVIVGCFILFGAATIAAGIRSTAEAAAWAHVPVDPPPIAPPPYAPPIAQVVPANRDPYAGASLPSR